MIKIIVLQAIIGLSLLAANHAQAQLSAPNGGEVRTGTLPASWMSGGPKCMEMPEWQVHEYNPDFYLLRQSGCTDYEKPFVFLLFGKQRALLLDSGSRNSNIAPEISLLMHRWLKRNGRTDIPLTVVHTHGHGDHIAGDAALEALHDPHVPITVIPATVEANRAFYGMAHWPEDVGSVDLGERVIDAIAIPGHQVAGVALYDRQTGVLFTGDSVYPGRLYIQDLTVYEQSNSRLVKFTEGKTVTHLLGNHIEQTRTPYLDYPVGTMYQPDEHALSLSRGTLLEIKSALETLHGRSQLVAYPDFSLVPSSPPTPEAKAAYEKTVREQTEHMWDQNQR